MDKNARLKSLDALRGFDFFWIFVPTYPLVRFFMAAMGWTDNWLYGQFEHPEWIGLTFYDSIFPLFLFLAGVSFPFSLAGSRKRGCSTTRIVLNVLRRAAILYFLGMIVSGAQALKSTVTISSVIGRIGVTWAVAALLYLAFRWKTRLAIVFGILALYAVFPFLVVAPGAPGGIGGYEKIACIYWWWDENVFPKPLFYHGMSGLVPMVATAMIGMFAGEWLRGEGTTPARKSGGLVLMGVGALVLGLFVAYCLGPWRVPFCKLCWSSSFALVMAGYSFLMLALFHWVIDVKGWVAWSFPFRVIGMNAIFVYCAARFICPFGFLKHHLFGGVAALMPSPEWGTFTENMGYAVLYWLLLWWMYRREIFIKV